MFKTKCFLTSKIINEGTRDLDTANVVSHFLNSVYSQLTCQTPFCTSVSLQLTVHYLQVLNSIASYMLQYNAELVNKFSPKNDIFPYSHE